MARRQPRVRARPATRNELVLFVASVAPWMRVLASHWSDHLPGRVRFHLRNLADQADSILRREQR